MPPALGTCRYKSVRQTGAGPVATDALGTVPIIGENCTAHRSGIEACSQHVTKLRAGSNNLGNMLWKAAVSS